jgi:hypothetical protein
MARYFSSLHSPPVAASTPHAPLDALSRRLPHEAPGQRRAYAMRAVPGYVAGGEDIDGDGAPLQWFRGVSFSLACKSRR